VEGTIANTSDSQSYAVMVPAAASELKATVVWTDPAASPGAATALINNLDLVLIAPNGVTQYFPFVLDKNSPGSNATTGVNTVDNVEQVIVPSPTQGEWTLRVTGTAVPSGPQGFTLVAEGLGGAGTSQNFTIFNDGTGELSVSSIVPDSTAPWISWSPPAPFAVAPGGSRAVAVTVDYGLAPAGASSRRLLVSSDDPDESPYPGGVNINVTTLAPSSGETLFVPIDPCRITDTRVSGGAFGGETVRSYSATGSGLSGQGGEDDCGIPATATAISLNFTAVSPVGFGYLRAWPYGESEPMATLMAFNGGVSISNATALTICGGCANEFSVKIYGANTHLVTEVVGYYEPIVSP